MKAMKAMKAMKDMNAVKAVKPRKHAELKSIPDTYITDLLQNINGIAETCEFVLAHRVERLHARSACAGGGLGKSISVERHRAIARAEIN